ncbi:Transcriptional regulator, IclR family [Pseudonocardia sp. Ae168_Ps1]|uniref:IclR family transcriptional regulator n=1 Tax=unclassified Pseudonocardia TaxID=2619320 RepID=UPI00094AF430|nr:MULTISPECIES: IclR family transcriptional regulator [unclassified Pseudonocardia]OLL72218.1 Transcriptional regulator, IclR family [Pseudonocardia sp. Ae150A_Ps1]OLL78187.1 Transcriptional regulator, IclR family [Pseudonocardia sp. Ae168_Ps1]OLL87691.1 Transcriptional regulator, IclR family [Pseudonocardia sp. Ae263_Ps1]OLL92282.1 Transcriptional regulator, IclR family [Pseudonocardia sp. Ae356_Ps1]
MTEDGREVRAPAGTQAIGRALRMVKLLAEEGRELSLPSIAARLDLTSGAAHRIIRALIAEGLVTYDSRTDCYHLGPGTVLLGLAAQRGFGLDKALPVLERVNADTEESVNLTIREQRDSVVLLRVQSTLPLRFEQSPGARFPLYTTAAGKAILAHSADATVYLDSLPDELPALTDRTLRRREEVAEQLVRIREVGYSVDEEENVAGVRCVGAPVVDSRGRAQAAVVVQVPTVRMPPERMAVLGELAMDAAADVARYVPIDRSLSR